MAALGGFRIRVEITPAAVMATDPGCPISGELSELWT